MSVERDFYEWEQQMQETGANVDSLDQAPDEAFEPYGTDMLINPTSTEVELGVLACINGSGGSSVDDDTGLGTKTDDWVRGVDNTVEPTQDVFSLS